MTFTFGTNSCASEAGTTRFPRQLNGGNERRAWLTDQIFRRHFNSLTPTKGACRRATTVRLRLEQRGSCAPSRDVTNSAEGASLASSKGMFDPPDHTASDF